MEPPGDDVLREIYSTARTIAVVGASSREDRPAHTVPRYLQRQGYRIVPVRPGRAEILGEASHPRLRDVPGPIDVVQVFRRPDRAAGIAREAAEAGASVLWFQPGTESEEGIRIAAEHGMTVVWDRCMKVTHRELGLGPRPEDAG